MIVSSYVLTLTSQYHHSFLDKEFWYKDAQEGIRRRLALFGESHLPEDRAKNIILMVGDGMGLSTLTASRILKGQRMGIHGEEYHLAWDKFPAVALAKPPTSPFTAVPALPNLITLKHPTFGTFHKFAHLKHFLDFTRAFRFRGRR
ncbi:hypothetical protein M8J76_009732 [Diaphorina citri]|nr:hypothetical protein M8J75_013581 [Diaphorina citri]KAI5723699.1 hypothetical protein M8J76_009732 [Diaphorina citri]